VKAIKATGYDVCTTASNHAVDQGFAGVRRTLDDLDRAKIAHAGTARTTPNRSGQRSSRRGRASRSDRRCDIQFEWIADAEG
jgi:poly-gamma-glutamate synthesis protein (capsule biosynthesis protein)